MTKISDLKNIFQANKSTYLTELSEYISFKSVSADPAFIEDCNYCAKWLSKHLTNIGLNSEILTTGGCPTVYAERIVDSKAPTLLVYGHYDVQPAAWDENWHSDPFVMTSKGDDLFARGIGDNKGQTFYIIKAVQHLLSKDALNNINLKFLIEGEEECGSPNTMKSLASWKSKLGCDQVLICDSMMLTPTQPVVAVGMRGIFAFNATLKGPDSDVHSGHFGGLIKNPATEMSKLVAKLFNEDGTIAVPGYYDAVPAPTEEDLSILDDLPNLNTMKEVVGMEALGTEKGIHPRISNMYRPTIEINGIQSGYNGAGSKSIIPSSATLNVTCRTVGKQDPEHLAKIIQKYLQEHCPKELTLTFEVRESGCSGIKLGANAKGKELAAQVFNEMFDSKCLFYTDPASIPIIPTLVKYTSEDLFVTGFGLQDDNWHGFNERFSISRFEMGFVFSTLYIERFAEWYQ